MIASRLKRSRGRQGGMTLVELIISMALGLIILGAMSTLFITNSQNRREIDNVAQQLENGRYAIRLLRDELQVAGFYGEYSSPSGVAAITPCDVTLANWDDALELSVVGSNDADGYTCLNSLSSGIKRKDNGAAIMVQRASTQCLTCCSVGGACDTSEGVFATNTAYFQTALCETDIDAGTGYVLAMRGISSEEETATDPFTLRARTCTSAARGPIRPFLRKIFYISENATLNVLTLKPGAAPTDGDSDVLVDGIEDMQFEFGVDTDGDGAPDEFKETPASATEWSNVMGVKVWILARAPETTQGYSDEKTYTLAGRVIAAPGDAYKRHVFSTYVEFVTPAGRRP